MKNKKILFLGIITVGLLFITQAHTAFALKKAIFPDPHSVQPIPEDALPNISGNVNSTTGAPEYQPAPEEVGVSQEGIIEESLSVENAAEQSPKKNQTALIIWPLIILVLIIGFFVYRRIKNRKNVI